MAQVIKDVRNLPPAATSRRYPWREWLDGQVWELVQGEDFDLPPVTMRNVIYMAGRRLGIKVAIRYKGRVMRIQAVAQQVPTVSENQATQADIDEVLRMSLEGESVRQIARHIGRSEAWVIRRRKQLRGLGQLPRAVVRTKPVYEPTPEEIRAKEEEIRRKNGSPLNVTE